MKRKTTVEAEMPFFKVRYGFTVYQSEKVSGMDFMLLKMIDLAGELDVPEMELSRMMDIFAVHRSLLPLVTKLFRNLAEQKFVRIPFNVDENSDVKKFSLTDSGRRVLEDRIVSELEKEIEKTLYCYPAKKEGYDIDAPPKITGGHAKIRFDKGYEEEGAEYAKSNPKLLYKGTGEIVNHFVSEIPRASTYLQKIALEFDGETGRFRICDDYGVKTDFIVDRYSGDVFLEKLPDGMFVLSGGYEAKPHLSEKPAEATDWCLPSDLNLSDAAAFCNSSSFSAISEKASGLPGDADCDMKIVESRLKGYKCWFVETENVFEKLETGRKVMLVAYRNLSRDEIDALTENDR